MGDVASLSTPSPKDVGTCPPSGVGLWLLELGAATRQAGNRCELHQSQGHRLRAWSSRRSRRRVVRQALADTIAGAFDAEPRLAVQPLAAGRAPQAAAVAESSESRLELPHPRPERPLEESDRPVQATAAPAASGRRLVALPPLPPQQSAEPAAVRLPPVAAEIAWPSAGGERTLGEPEPAGEPILTGLAASSIGEGLAEYGSSTLLERLSAYTLGPSLRVG